MRCDEYNDDAKLEKLIGQTLVHVEKTSDDEELLFTTSTGEKYKLYHNQNCCESVKINDVCGDLQDLVDTPLLNVEEVVSDKRPEDVPAPEYEDSATWSFYKFATIRGSVTVRWYGSSNGYYSETVDFAKVT